MSCGYFQLQPFWMAYWRGFGDFHLANLLMVHPYFIESAAFIEAQLARDLNKRLPDSIICINTFRKYLAF
jgi:hypothetical protein